MSHNTWMHRIVRPAVRPLVNTAVTPNHLTTVRLLTGLAATGLVASGTPAMMSWGAGLFLVSMLFDRADGILARLSGKTSEFGHKFDLVTDALCNAIIFVGLGVGNMGSHFGAWAVVLGLLAGGAVATILLVVVRAESLEGARAAELAGAAGFDPDDAMLIIPLMLWLGWSQWLLIAAAIGAPAFAVYVVWKFRAVIATRS